MTEPLESRVLLAAAQLPAQLLADLNKQPESSNPSDFFTHNGITYFAAKDGDHGDELWKTDGTAAGTVLVKDINPGTADSRPHSFLAIGDTIYFEAGPSDSVFAHLWRTDGTTAGTREVYDTGSFSGNFPLTAYKGAAVFLVDNQLFRADSSDHVEFLGGDPQGSTFGNPSLAQAGGLLYAAIATDPIGEELWVSDGTASGTHLLKDIAPGDFQSSLPRALANLSGKLLFGASDSGGINGADGQLWVTNGTSAGTVVIKRGVFPSSMVVVGSLAYFVNTSGANDELWKTDGTNAGTVRIKSFPSSDSSLQQLHAFNGKLYFLVGAVAAPSAVWQSDGTANGTVPVSAIPGGANVRFQLVTVLNGTLYLTRQVLSSSNPPDQVLAETWTIDAAGNAARLVVTGNINTDFFPTPQIGVTPSGKVYFAGDDAAHGRELWSIAGPGATPHLIKDIFAATQGSNELTDFVRFRGAVYFVANDQIVKTDGTAGGTSVVADLTAGREPVVSQLFVAGKMMFFTAEASTGSAVHLWHSDGTVAGTDLVKPAQGAAPGPFPNSFTAFHGALYFKTVDQSTGVASVWRTDGTAAGTYKLGTTPFERFAAAGGRLFLLSRDSTSSRVDLWVSDGTVAGTRKIFTRSIQQPDQFMYEIVAAIGAGNTFYFTLGTFQRSTRNEVFVTSELWKSDGTTSGTKSVSTLPFRSEDYVESGGLVYFRGEDDDHTGAELWRTDGTATGTRLVRDIIPGSDGSFPFQLTDVDGLLFFIAETSQSGNEVWRSDGTAQGTFMLRDIEPGADTTSFPQDLTAIDGMLYFNEDDGVHGRELWRSDGTTAGTTLAIDVRPGAIGSDPTPQLAIGNRLLFTAAHPTAGVEPWVATLPSAGLLRIDGTDGEDVINVQRADASTLRITVNGTVTTHAIVGLNEIRINGAGGEDLISVDPAVTTATGLEGGDGDDTLRGGGGADAFFGGAGSDTVDYSGRRQNLTIGIGVRADDGAPGEHDNVHRDIENVIGGASSDLIRGSFGANRLSGGGASDVIVGLGGDDTLGGGNGRDVLIGGAGADQISGDAFSDALVGGSTTLDNNDSALRQLLTIWSNGHATYAQRVASLTSSSALGGGRVSGDATDVNTLRGGASQDFFITGPVDVVADLESGESVQHVSASAAPKSLTTPASQQIAETPIPAAQRPDGFPTQDSKSATGMATGVHLSLGGDPDRAIPILKDLGAGGVRLVNGITNWNDRNVASTVFENAIKYHNAGFRVVLTTTCTNAATYAEARAYFQWALTVPGLKAAVDQWEIQNEVDLPQYYDHVRDWAYYVNNDLRGAWDALHPAGEKVISGAVFSLDGARGLHAAGVEQYCDTVGYHLYVADPATMVDRTAQLKSMFGDEPITLTEWNFRASSDTLWTRYLREAHRFIASNFESAYYFRFSVNDAYTGRAGLVNADYTPHGAFYDAFKSWSDG